MTLLAIEKGIPLKERRGRPKIYPWESMEVGDSLLIPNMNSRRFGGRKTAVERRTGFKFATRTEGTGMRVWRVR